MDKLFGTDGIRGRAGEYPITPEMCIRIGRAIGRKFRQDGHNTRVVIAKDTRISGDMLEHAIASGVCYSGADAFLAGVLPTPALAFLIKDMAFDAGVMISASHNPFYDNGVKIFRGDGFKLSDEMELALEEFIGEEKESRVSNEAETIGRVNFVPNSCDRYVDFLAGQINAKKILEGLNVILDCANGATFEAAPAVFERLGADVRSIFTIPDGTNINDGCGSEHTERLVEKVVSRNADVGFAFDGDGDRVIAVDNKGGRISGDKLLVFCAKRLKDEGRLAGNMVVSTVMSNIGLSLALKEAGINHVTTKVGDRHVLREMLTRGACLGGEDSGHMIFLDHHTTGDGILAALKVSQIIKTSGKAVDEVAGLMKVFPQRLINVEVQVKRPIEDIPEIVAAIERVEGLLGEKGRVLVRYSGTQPICRIMVESPTKEETERFSDEIAEVIRKRLGT
ncbi:MAG: phosphoglucosamine mutase [Deltaproteobacteria bacterium]|nr:phosphoglucosamine mutase [Deltaproteobacteria bacterium]MBW2264585.1 phosphoglucosamine mutase [Deltaproteobacteria bacterium]MBW2317070.1 phosphoglucosamine mutase [Deltaproteobacteria bacterium]MBW2600389.1 phosphoglucosamine mutase [Deltaproteobacteria bacterium]